MVHFSDDPSAEELIFAESATSHAQIIEAIRKHYRMSGDDLGTLLDTLAPQKVLGSENVIMLVECPDRMLEVVHGTDDATFAQVTPAVTLGLIQRCITRLRWNPAKVRYKVGHGHFPKVYILLSAS